MFQGGQLAFGHGQMGGVFQEAGQFGLVLGREAVVGGSSQQKFEAFGRHPIIKSRRYRLGRDGGGRESGGGHCHDFARDLLAREDHDQSRLSGRERGAFSGDAGDR